MTKFQIGCALVLATAATAALAAVAHAGTPPSAPVPEPGTTLLLLGGLGVAMWWRKGRR